MIKIQRVAALVTIAAVGLSITGCSSDSGESGPADTAAPGTEALTTDAPVTAESSTTVESTPQSTESATTDAPPSTDAVDEPGPMSAPELVELLASDELNGRDNQTEYSVAAQDILIGQLEQFAEPALADAQGRDGYLQPFEIIPHPGSEPVAGTNVVGVIPGGDLADEWVIIGAHYDHVGNDCPTDDPADDICNGATDNATGVAVVMDTARAIAAAGTPRRSVLVAFWDAEEDGLLGATAYLADPLVPVESTVAYMNFDIQGANLLPSAANSTVMVGAETGGAPLIAAASAASEASSLDTLALSLLFGQGRSDHAPFVAAGVPSVFFTDANNACYHTAQDEIDIVDFPKLEQQTLTSIALALDLVATDDPPVFDPAAPATTYEDAAALYELVSAGQADLGLLDADGQAAAEQYIVDLGAVVDAGPEAFDDEAIGVVLGGAVTFVDALTRGTCDGYVTD